MWKDSSLFFSIQTELNMSFTFCRRHLAPNIVFTWYTDDLCVNTSPQDESVSCSTNRGVYPVHVSLLSPSRLSSSAALAPLWDVRRENFSHWGWRGWALVNWWRQHMTLRNHPPGFCISAFLAGIKGHLEDLRDAVIWSEFLSCFPVSFWSSLFLLFHQSPSFLSISAFYTTEPVLPVRLTRLLYSFPHPVSSTWFMFVCECYVHAQGMETPKVGPMTPFFPLISPQQKPSRITDSAGHEKRGDKDKKKGRWGM